MYSDEESLEKYIFITAEYVNGKTFMFCPKSTHRSEKYIYSNNQ